MEANKALTLMQSPLILPPDGELIAKIVSNQHPTMSIAYSELMTSDTRNLGPKVISLQKHLPHLSIPDTVRDLSALSDTELRLIKYGYIGGLVFDVAFSPGVTPEKQETAYRDAYQDFFQTQYEKPFFNAEGNLKTPDERDFYYNPLQAANDTVFIMEWISNLRAVALMLRHFRPYQSVEQTICTNLIEAALCRMAENGDPWPDDLLNSLPYPIQARLLALRDQVDVARRRGRLLLPGHFFQIANALEQKEQLFMRQSTAQRVQMVIDEIGERHLSDPLSMADSNQKRLLPFEKSLGRNSQQHLSLFLRTQEHAQNWTQILLNHRDKPTLSPEYPDFFK